MDLYFEKKTFLILILVFLEIGGWELWAPLLYLIRFGNEFQNILSAH